MNKLFCAVALLVSIPLAACGGDSDTGGEAGGSTSTTVTSADDSSAHAAVIEQRVAATNAKDWDSWEALHTADAVRTAPDLPEPLEGAAAMRAAIEQLTVAFPDYHLEVVRAFGEGDWLSVEIHTTGTNTGPLAFGDLTLPATGKSISQDWSAVVRFEGDKIAEFHEYYDLYELMGQLGLAP